VAKAGVGVRRRAAAIAALALAAAAATALLAVEVANGAADAGALAVRDPCAPRRAYPGQGIDATVQRVVLDGLDGAACELGTTREELVLSLAPRTGAAPGPWDDATIERALRAGLLEAVDDAEQRGSLNGLVAAALRQVAQHAPVQWLVDGGQGVAGLFD
jgi:hypothetical protein